MANKIELLDEELMAINGGRITYTWDGETGTIGINDNNPYILVDKDAFVAYFKSVQGTMKDSEILRHLRENGVIRLP